MMIIIILIIIMITTIITMIIIFIIYYPTSGNNIRLPLGEAPVTALGFEPETFRSAGRHSKQLSYLGKQKRWCLLSFLGDGSSAAAAEGAAWWVCWAPSWGSLLYHDPFLGSILGSIHIWGQWSSYNRTWFIGP
jgi:hypothetical protein